MHIKHDTIAGGLRKTLPAVTVAALAMATAGASQAQVCNGLLTIGQISVEDPNTVGSVDRIRIRIGTDAITQGTLNQLTVQQLFFELDCLQGSTGSEPCNDEGGIISYRGDGTITSDCVGSVGSSVTWTTTHATGTSPNQVVFNASPAVVIPANRPSFCEIAFDIRKEANATADGSPDQIEQQAGFRDASCDNGLDSTIIQSSALPFEPILPEPAPAPAASSWGLLLLCVGLLWAGRAALR